MQDNKEWSVVVQRVGTQWAEIWLGNLSSKFNAQFRAQLSLYAADQITDAKNLIDQKLITEWQAPFSDYGRGQFQRVKFEQLTPNKYYRLDVKIATEGKEFSDSITQATFNCLPTQLPRENEKSFTIAFGSCFANHDDHGQLSAAYQALYTKGPENYQPNVSFLIGDQVYLDASLAALVPIKSFIRKRIATIYAENWRTLSGIFTQGANWLLPDDHEYWNDYPFNKLPILALQALKIPFVKNTWMQSANDAVDNIQSAKMFETIEIGDDLSICLVNTRTHRTEDHFLPPENFQQLITWAENLRTPGVLVLPQNLFDKAHDIERNLLSYPKQYAELVQALTRSGKDIVVLSGDVHFGRIGQTSLGDSGAKLVEIVASPLANLSGLFDGIATAKATDDPSHFPPLDKPVAGVVNQPITYPAKVDSIKGHAFTKHPKDRTKEHFMTVSFKKLATGEIQLSAQAWLIGEVDEAGVPKPGFANAWTCSLKP